MYTGPGVDSLSHKTSYCKISQSRKVGCYNFLITLNLFAIRQHCHRGACQISKRHEHFNTRSRALNNLRDHKASCSILNCISPDTWWATITVTSYWARWRPRPPVSRLFTQPFVQTQIKEITKAPRHWPLWGEFTGNWWIPRTKDQWRGKYFHLMTSSWWMKMKFDIIGLTSVTNF